MFSYFTSLFLNLKLLTLTNAYPNVISGNFNSLLFVNQAFLNCPLKKAKLTIVHESYGDDFVGKLPCNNVEQMQNVTDNFLISMPTSFKANVIEGWSLKNHCKPLLSITEGFFSVANVTTCHCFVTTVNDAITKSSFDTVKTCEFLMQKWRLCRHVNDILSLMRPHVLRVIRSSSSVSELLLN